MLLEFKATNYKSFKDDLILSMIPAPKQSGLDYSIIKETVGKKTYKGLCSSVCYGPNASGKSNIIGALDTFKRIVLRGNIKNSEKFDNPNTASNLLELIPNISNKENTPVTFFISFITDGFLIEYYFSAIFGKFMENDTKRKIVSEELKINEKRIFKRTEELEFNLTKDIEKMMIETSSEKIDFITGLAANGLIEDELFLVNGFKNIFSSKLMSIIMNWMSDKLNIVYRADDLSLTPELYEQEDLYIDKPINNAISIFNTSSNKIGYLKKGNNVVEMVSVLDDILIESVVFESYGTVRLANLLPLIINTFRKGGALIIDEFDASIHPMAIISIINVFHNDEINKNHAQLIFNTHNPMFLNSNIFRRDEIKFVERDETTQSSTIYSLADFSTTGESSARKRSDYMKHYFLGRYGAIKEIDFTPFFEKVIETEEE